MCKIAKKLPSNRGGRSRDKMGKKRILSPEERKESLREHAARAGLRIEIEQRLNGFTAIIWSPAGKPHSYNTYDKAHSYMYSVEHRRARNAQRNGASQLGTL